MTIRRQLKVPVLCTGTFCLQKTIADCFMLRGFSSEHFCLQETFSNGSFYSRLWREFFCYKQKEFEGAFFTADYHSLNG